MNARADTIDKTDFMIMQDIKEYFPEMTDEEILSNFTSSKTYSDLFKTTNGLWAEGPDYIMNMYLEEINHPIS